MAISKPSPYVPSFLRAALSGSRPLTLTWDDVADTNISSTSSFQYDPHASPLKSTQQLNVDWSQFQNHTFFMSAEAKVNLAFDSIINGFPFDGTRQETEVFFEKLTGFDRWVFDNFPVYHGELLFSGTQVGETSPSVGTYIVTQNKTGALFPELSKVSSGEPVLNPTGSQSLTIEMQLYLPTIPNDTQVICQMLSGTATGPGTQGFSFYLTPSTSPLSCSAQFSVVSGSSYMTVPVTLTKGIFNHVAVMLNRDNGLPFLESFLLSTPVRESPTQVEIGNMAIDGSPLIIGSGTQLQLGAQVITPTQTLSGTMDEFRIFHSARTPKQQAAFAAKAIFATTDLVLYFRFNEPGPPIAGSMTDPINAIVLDSSGNSLHSLISNFTSSLRLNAEFDVLNPLVYERPDSVPVLFPAYPATVAFNQQLLASASVYDQENPNLITKLIPQHYLLEGAQQDGFIEPPEGNANQPFGGTGIPGSGQMGNVQILVSLLYIWARFFDEIKLFVDSFSTLRTVHYDTNDTVPDNFLLDLVKSFGFHLPPLFNDSTLEQYIRGENVDLQSITTSEQSLRQVQNQLLRRVLVNLPDVLKSKGTQHSIKSFLRAVGIDPGNNVRIREFGGPTTQVLSFTRESKLEPGTMVQFSTASVAFSPYLSGTRVEPGFPLPAGNFIIDPNTHRNIGTTNSSDGLFTSGSWTWEGIVKYTPAAIKLMTSATQSLQRMCVVGSSDLFGDDTFGSESPFGFEVSVDEDHLGLVANLLAVSSSTHPKLVLYLRPNDLSPSASLSPLLRLELDTAIPNIFTGPRPIGIFDFERWNVSFGCRRGDDGLGSAVSSSYFLRLAYQNNGEIQHLFETSSFFQESPKGGASVFQVMSTGSSFLGPFLAVGHGQDFNSGTGSIFLNNILAAPDEARVTDFNGRISNVRFWSRYLTLDEWREHVRNYNSVGVEDPLVNWNYGTTRTGSFGRLRMNTMIRQDVRRAVATASLGMMTGTIDFPDFSENNMHMTGANFPIDQDIVVGEVFDLSYLSPYFDEASSDEKVRARSFQNFDLVQQTPWASLAPVYELVHSEQPTDDVRFIIEFSLIDALNRDIVTMFATLDAIDNALGAPELVFSPDYPDLQRLRDIYFNRIKEKLNFQAFFEFFRWFDTSIGTFIQQLIPRKTRFKGTNFTIESHMLERAKQEYLSSEIYLGDSIRQRLDAVILLQQIVGTLRKY
jgi:hypothetical protein